MVMIPISRLAVPVLVTVAFSVELEEPISTEPKSMLEGEIDMSGISPGAKLAMTVTSAITLVSVLGLSVELSLQLTK